jgi:glycosyltransferase involved in cell wall biosynthesis
VHIAFVSHAYPRRRGDVAGAFIARLASALVQRGHVVTAVVPADRGHRGEDEVDGVRVLRVGYAPALFERLAHRGSMLRETATPWGAAAFLSLVRTLGGAIATCEADAVHAHWWVPAGLAAARAAGRGAPAPVISLHGTDVRLLDRAPGAARLARRVFRSASAVTAVSTVLGQRAAARVGVEPSAIPVIPMPADLSALPREPGHDGEGLVTVSRLTRQKRVHILLRAAAELTARGTPRSVTIVGDGPERRRLERLARSLGLADVHFAGAVPPRDVAGLLQRGAVAVFPARAEGFGLAAAEALMSGVPVVAAADGGGILDIVPQIGPGRVARPHDIADWADAIAELDGSVQAREEAWALGQDWRDRLDPLTIAARFEALYAQP